MLLDPLWTDSLFYLLPLVHKDHKGQTEHQWLFAQVFFGKSWKPHAYHKKLNSAVVAGASGSSLNTWKYREEVEKHLDLKKDAEH